MAPVSTRLIVDASVAAKWKLTGEPQESEAVELFHDWRHLVFEVTVPGVFPVEVTSTFLRAYRRGRVTETVATDAIRDLLGLPFVLHSLTAPLGVRAFAIARQYNQGAFDCA